MKLSLKIGQLGILLEEEILDVSIDVMHKTSSIV